MRTYILLLTFSNDRFGLNIQNELVFETYWIKYWNVSPDTNASLLCQNIRWILQEFNLNTRNVVVMAESINVLRDIEKCYTTKDCRCMTNFETASEYEELRRAQTSPSLFQKDLKEIRRAAKTHFTTDTRYDGYYIQERENIPALIYTALTRAKCNLFILNVGNTKYHSFFQTNIRQ